MSDNVTLHSTIVRDLRRLVDQAQTLTGQPRVAQLQMQCLGALEHVKENEVSSERPVHVALVGGTGVGKSSLFNLLIGQEGASPESHMRPFTSHPYVACSASIQTAVTLPPDLEWKFVPTANIGNFVLIDTPDFNSVELAHHEIARRVIELSDIIVFMVLPDQRADFAIIGELERWKERKHWFFVVSKIDREPADLHDKIRMDFDQRVRALGFEATDASRFLISTTHSADTSNDIENFRAALFATKPKHMVYLSRVFSVLGWIERAIDTAAVEELKQFVDELHNKEQELDEEIRTAYRFALAEPSVRSIVADLALEQGWIHAARRTHGPIALALHLRNRLALFAMGFHLTRMLLGSVTLARLVQVTFSSFLAAARGLLPALQIADALGQRLGRDLDKIQNRTQHILEDHGLDTFAAEDESLTEPGAPVAGRTPMQEHASSESGEWLTPHHLPRQLARAVVDETSQRVVSLFETLISPKGPAAPLLEPLQHSLMQMGAETANRAVRLPQQILANSLPVAAGGHIVYRLVDAWLQASAPDDYLPLEFYLMALTIFSASCIPGYVWLSVRLHSSGASLDVESVVERIEEPSQTARLREVRRRMQRLVGDAERLRNSVLTMRWKIAPELTHVFGIRSLSTETPLQLH